MKITVIAKTCETNNKTYDNINDAATIFAGKNAGICYMPNDYTSDGINDEESCLKRAKFNIKSGHYSVYEHYHITFLLEEIPKMISLLDGETDVLYFGSYYSDYEDGRKSQINILKNEAKSGIELCGTEFAHCAQYYLMRRPMLDEYNLRFKEGILHEDSMFTPVMITHCKKVRRYELPVYHHLMRGGSITHTVSPKRINDMIFVIRELILYGESLPETIRWKWGRCIAQITNGVLLCSRDCKDKEAKNHLKEFVNNNTSVIKYLAHSGVKNRIMAKLATLTGGRLYQVYGILSKIRY